MAMRDPFFSRRLRRIMASMHIIREGDYTHKVTLGGNDELTALGDEFNDLTERLQTSEQKRRRFVSDASHELKTPLTVIMTNAEMLLEENHSAVKRMQFSESILTMSKQMRGLTESLLELARSDNHTVNTVFENVDFSSLVSDAVLPFEPLYFAFAGAAAVLFIIISAILYAASKAAARDEALEAAWLEEMALAAIEKGLYCFGFWNGQCTQCTGIHAENGY